MIAYRDIPSGDNPALKKGDTTFQRVLLIHKRGDDFGLIKPRSIFLLMTLIFVVRTAVLHRHEQRQEEASTSSTSALLLSKGMEHFRKSNEEASPLWSYSTLYDEDDDRLQEYDAALTDFYERHFQSFLWVEVGVMLVAPHLSMHKLLFASPTMRAVLRQQSRVLKQHSRLLTSHSKKVVVAMAKGIKAIYKNRSRVPDLVSDYTWYFTIEEDEKNPSTKKIIDIVVDGR